MKFPLPDVIATSREDIELRRLSLIDATKLHKLLFRPEASETKLLVNDSCENLWTKFEDSDFFSQELKNPAAQYYGVWIDESMIGGASFTSNGISPDEVRVGFWLSRKHSGHGYARCIARSMGDAVFAAGYASAHAIVRCGGMRSTIGQIVLLHEGFTLMAKDMHLLFFARTA